MIPPPYCSKRQQSKRVTANQERLPPDQQYTASFRLQADRAHDKTYTPDILHICCTPCDQKSHGAMTSWKCRKLCTPEQSNTIISPVHSGNPGPCLVSKPLYPLQLRAAPMN